MKEATFGIARNHDFVRDGEYRFDLYGVNDEKVTLELNKSQFALIEARWNRAFYVRYPKEKILREIENAGGCAEMADIAKKYWLCDVCVFDDINLYGVKRILKVIVETLYKYPKLRSKLCFIGTHRSLEKLLERMERGDREVLKAFDLHYICSPENAAKLVKAVRGFFTGIDKSERYVATAMCAFGLLDSVLLERNEYDGYAYLSFVSQLRRNEASGFHPKGCHTPESVIYHELGHLLDDMCGLSNSPDFTAYHKSLTEKAIESGLSHYALSSPKEFIAEAFAESMCSSAPRQIAEKTSALLNAAYEKRR